MLAHARLRKKRRGQSYDVAGARRGSGGPADLGGVGEFRRIDSLAKRGGQRLLRNVSLEEEGAGRTRRGSDGALKVGRLAVVQNMLLRRSSSPTIGLDTQELARLQARAPARPHSTYLELLEEVTSDLNLKDMRHDSFEDGAAVDSMFGFLNNEEGFEEGPKVMPCNLDKTCPSPILLHSRRHPPI
jgi:hypothetical protein